MFRNIDKWRDISISLQADRKIQNFVDFPSLSRAIGVPEKMYCTVLKKAVSPVIVVELRFNFPKITCKEVRAKTSEKLVGQG